MVAEVTTGNGFRGTISYVKKEHEKDLPLDKKPEIIEENNIYGDTQKMAQQMRFVSNGNTRVSRPVLHISLNFHKDEKLTPQQEQKAVKSVLKELGVKEDTHQYLIAKHNDAGHPHYHIVLNKVDLNGKNIDTSYIKNKMQVICDKIEQEQGLRRTEGRTVMYDPTKEKGYRFATSEEKAKYREANKKTISDKNPKNAIVKRNIEKQVAEALQDRGVNSPEHFKASLQQKGIDVKFTENKNGISGVSFRYQEVSIKGSQINAKWGDLDKSLTTNAILSKERDLRAYIEENTTKTSQTVTVVDQAIRETMPTINQNTNPWETWNKNPQSEKLYNELHTYSQKMQETKKEQKTAFDIAKEQRNQGQSQEQNQEKSNNPFDKLKAQREEKKDQSNEQKRGFGR